LARPLAALFALAAATLAGPALGSEPFPAAIQAHLGLSTAPGCALCHQAESAPVGAADKPFSASAEARGLVAGDVASLEKALDQMRADGVDSDGDGAEDLDELWWGGDPNHADLPAGGTQDPPTYGCATRPGDARSEGAIALLLVAALFARRRNARG
jgi:MYXO-CTERM domain-containing protein